MAASTVQFVAMPWSSTVRVPAGTTIVAVSFTARDPKLAANFVNTLVSDYLAVRAARRTGADQSANAVLTQLFWGNNPNLPIQI